MLRSLYATYKPRAGRILVDHDGSMVDLLDVGPWEATANSCTSVYECRRWMRNSRL
ncbi:hypothetical protein [Bradyrhizobium sp. ORS 111]|uniref:hypothetical protein n=1 Tax=Bradyrhizobium sp. ORS 111 TaxID=1685958 RepID=UPI00388E70AE